METCDHKFVDSHHCLKCGWTPPPRCPTCGFVMCEKFEERTLKGMTLAVPTGVYECLSGRCDTLVSG
jgi:hypothetical protein